MENTQVQKSKIKLAGEYIYHHGVISKFGTGALSVSTDTCLKIQSLIEDKFDLNHAEFSQAFKHGEFLDHQENEAEAAFFRSHPELNP